LFSSLSSIQIQDRKETKMYFFQVLFFLLVPLFALANPAPAPQATISSTALADLEGLVSGAKTLLSQDSINNIETTLTGAATLLSGSTANDTKTLLTEVSGLLTPELISAVTKLVTADTVNKLNDIVDNAHTLLTANFVNQTVTLIDDVTPVNYLLFFIKKNQLLLRRNSAILTISTARCRPVQGTWRTAFCAFGLSRSIEIGGESGPYFGMAE
jgi:hypothetical protein